MTNTQLKDRIAYLLFFAKFIVVIWVFLMWLLSDQYDGSKLAIILAIIIPLFSMHLTMIIRNYLEDKEKKRDTGIEVRRPLVVFSHILPILYALFLILFITMVPLLLITFDTLISMLCVLEPLIGIYLGMIVSELYKPQKAQKKKK